MRDRVRLSVQRPSGRGGGSGGAGDAGRAGAAIGFSAAALLLASGGASLAQVAPPPASLQTSPIPRMEPVAPPRVGPGDSALPASPTPTQMPDRSIAVTAVQIRDVTMPFRAVVEAEAQALVGPSVPLQKIEDFRVALLKRYRDGGYPLVTVQATRSAGGVLVYRVYEGRVVDVKLEGEDIGPAGTRVLGFLRQIVSNGPVKASELERYLLLAQDVPGISLQAVLRPSDTDPAAITLVATVSRQAISGLYTSDNRAYPLTGPYQGLAAINFNSFTSLGDRTELSLYHTYNGTQIFGQASTEVFLGNDGLRLKIYGGAGNVLPSGFLDTLGYNGFTTVAGTQLTYPLIRQREQTLNLFGSFDALDSQITTAPSFAGFSAPRAPASKDSLRVLRLGADYALRDIWLGPEVPAVNTALVRLSQGIAGLGATHNTATPARLGEKINFTKVNWEFSRNQTLFRAWDNATVSLLGLFVGQGSGDVLPPAEKFYLGGYRFTRGYYVGQVSGDSGIALTAELQLTTSNELNLFGRTLDVGQQYYLFYDYGYVWQNLRADPNKETKSFGLGARVQVTRYVEVDVEGVRRLTRNVDGANASLLKEYAVYYRVVTRF